MFGIIMMGTMLIIAVTVFASYQSSAKLRKNMWLSVTFPSLHVNRQEIQDIVQQFKKHNLIFFLITIILMLPVLLIKPTSLMLLYVTLWTVFVMLYENRLFCKYNSRLILLKSRKLWFSGEDYHLLDRSRLQRQRQELLHRFFPTALDHLINLTEEPIYVDEDEYWINGYYYNPDDRRTTVEKRVGVGSTSNMATKAGKFTTFGAAIFAAAILIPIFFIFVRMDFVTFQMVTGDTLIRFEAPLYSYEFALSEIEEVSLVSNLPKGGLRTNGAATEDYLLGNFRYDEYGKTKMYVYRNYPPYLVIKLPGRTVFYNSKLEEETLLAYELLLQKTEDK